MKKFYRKTLIFNFGFWILDFGFSIHNPKFIIQNCFIILLAALILSTSPVYAQAKEEIATPPQGSLSVLTDPGGAQVFLNGASYGKTPLRLSLPTGTYRLRLEKKGYITINEEIKVVEGEDTALDYELEEK